MRTFYTFGKIVIYCTNCLSKMRIPADKGKILVTCPVCAKNFIYNPNSILHTLKQIILLLRYFLKRRFPRVRKKQAILLVVALVAIIVLFFLIFTSLFSRKKPPDVPYSPGPVVNKIYMNNCEKKC